MTACIRIERLVKTYGRGAHLTVALDHVDLEIRTGEVFALLGPNGAGKTTLLYVLMGLLSPDGGRVAFPGLDLGPDDRPAERMNYVSGDSRFHWALRLRDVIDIYGRIYGMPLAEARRRGMELAETFGITDLLDRRFEELSTGQRMRAIFVKGFLNTPRVLLLDEPTLGLDVHVARRLREQVLEFNRRQGITLLLTSHYMAEVEALADRVGFILKGRIIDLGTPAEVKSRLATGHEMIVHPVGEPPAGAAEAAGFACDAEGLLRTWVPDGQAVDGRLSELLRLGVRIGRVESRTPDLEDYFLSMLNGPRPPAGESVPAVPGVSPPPP
jgi:ABC-2 type transport system ATP-binding protein